MLGKAGRQEIRLQVRLRSRKHVLRNSLHFVRCSKVRDPSMGPQPWTCCKIAPGAAQQKQLFHLRAAFHLFGWDDHPAFGKNVLWPDPPVQSPDPNGDNEGMTALDNRMAEEEHL